MMSTETLISSFSICKPFISFPCLISWARTSSMILKSGERRCSWFVYNLSGKGSSFFHCILKLVTVKEINWVFHITFEIDTSILLPLLGIFQVFLFFLGIQLYSMPALWSLWATTMEPTCSNYWSPHTL